ncbi:hypothetical protein [Pseudomonas amygdali]|uniref:hypothetical protein n=1 Tax=Pseudomonas amygdali TaxID=47877 RepID=UPI00244EC0B9|nr:hypothetical protein [Pseudomonas amygdali]
MPAIVVAAGIEKRTLYWLRQGGQICKNTDNVMQTLIHFQQAALAALAVTCKVSRSSIGASSLPYISSATDATTALANGSDSNRCILKAGFRPINSFKHRQSGLTRHNSLTSQTVSNAYLKIGLNFIFDERTLK